MCEESTKVNLIVTLGSELAGRHYEIMFLIHEDHFEEVPAIVKMMEGKPTHFDQYKAHPSFDHDRVQVVCFFWGFG